MNMVSTCEYGQYMSTGHHNWNKHLQHTSAQVMLVPSSQDGSVLVSMCKSVPYQCYLPPQPVPLLCWVVLGQ